MTRLTVKTRIYDAVHPRRFARSTSSLNARLQIVINEYIPAESAKTGLSVFLAHANGFHKELYEPFLEALATALQQRGVPLRSFWVADAAQQGASGVLNEAHLGDRVHWYDHSRDMLKACEAFDIPQPILAIGHSMGGTQFIAAHLLHPTKFIGIVALDAVIMDRTRNFQFNFARLSSKRRDIWPSRDEARRFFRSRKFYQNWDPRVLELHMIYGLRDLPTLIYPNAKGCTLTTSKHQEVYTFCEENFDADPPFFRLEATEMFDHLGEVIVPVLYLNGEKSPVTDPEGTDLKLAKTKYSQSQVVKGVGHLLPLEDPNTTAAAMTEFIYIEYANWLCQQDNDQLLERHPVLSERWMRTLAKF